MHIAYAIVLKWKDSLDKCIICSVKLNLKKTNFMGFFLNYILRQPLMPSFLETVHTPVFPDALVVLWAGEHTDVELSLSGNICLMLTCAHVYEILNLFILYFASL